MYLESIVSKNMGPINEAVIKAQFHENGDPKPIVIVGKNGTGKTILISNIVDSFYEFGSKSSYEDVVVPNSRFGHYYYKIASTDQIRVGTDGMFALIRYREKGNPFDFLYKQGNVSKDMVDKCLKRFGLDSSLSGDSKDEKQTSVDKESADSLLRENVLCFFPAERSSRPNWLNGAYSQEDSFAKVDCSRRYSQELKRPICIVDPTKNTAAWMTDVIVDSRASLAFTQSNQILVEERVDVRRFMTAAKHKIDSILSTILKRRVAANLGLRNEGSRRIFLAEPYNPTNLIIPAIDALSQGQAVLFNLFSTIVRYADSINLNQSVLLDQITGIVVIDEIELHLHSDLQRDVLPNLIKLFPKIQFIITTHAPLFVLGMQKTFGNDGFSLLEMPTAKSISAEEFSEFGKAYDYIVETERHHREMDDAIRKALSATNSETRQLLIVTEGASDWKHLRRAWSELRKDYPSLEGRLCWLEYESTQTEAEATSRCFLGMGNDPLVRMCKEYGKIRQSRPIVFIADSDRPNDTKALIDEGKPFKDWSSNNVFSFVIPSPAFRGSNARICIEHYYTNEELKTELVIGGRKRRLYLGFEFDCETRTTKEGDSLVCQNAKLCGGEETVPYIIEGDEGSKVLKPRDPTHVNYALPKMAFANAVLTNASETKNFNFNNFRLVFDILQKIVEKIDNGGTQQ